MDIARNKGRRRHQSDMGATFSEKCIAKGEHNGSDLGVLCQSICRRKEFRGLTRVDAMLNENNGNRRATQNTMTQCAQITVGRCRNDKRIKRPCPRLLIECTIPTEPSALTLHGEKQLAHPARIRIDHRSTGEVSHRHMIIRIELKVRRYIEHDFMSHIFQLVHKNSIEVNLVSTGRHNVFKDGNPHGNRPF